VKEKKEGRDIKNSGKEAVHKREREREEEKDTQKK
jgi:hypothetical protein